MFSLFKQTISNLFQNTSKKLKSLFGISSINEEHLKELETLLLQSDVGLSTTTFIMTQLKKEMPTSATGKDLHEGLKKIITTLLQAAPQKELDDILLLVGINGSGKTTSAAKLAYLFQQKNKSVFLIGADTFRAAAREQLRTWAQRLGISCYAPDNIQDPAAVVFKGCQEFLSENKDIAIVDTAGRLQTKTNLMNELDKIKRTITKAASNKNVSTLLIIDAMLGQNSLEQARIFNQATAIDGIILTKMDSSARGGIILAIAYELQLPILFVSSGENIESLVPFDATAFTESLFLE
jgi:fused signal recognition particle receptor